MRVFVTGGSGFVGKEVVGQLLAAGHEVRALARPGSEGKLPQADRLSLHPGDVMQPATLAPALDGCDAVVHLVGIIREFPGRGITFARLHTEATRNMVAAADTAGVKRFIHMSANGSREGAGTPYHQTKWAAEQILRQGNLDWTIFRPSLIFGPGDQFVGMLADLIRKLPLVPVIGNGRYRMSPVAVAAVAMGVVKALEMPGTRGKIYHCGGPQSLSYNEILDLVGRALGKSRVAKLHHPLLLMKPAVALLQSIPQFPLTSTQLTMLLEGNEVDPHPWVDTFGLHLETFFADIQSYLSPSGQSPDCAS